MTEGQTGPGEAITAMQTMLDAHHLSVHPHGRGLRVDLSNGTAVYLATVESANGPRWSARSGWTVVYEDIPADIDAATDAAWAAEAVARFAAEAERGTDLSDWFGGNLGQVLERAFQAHGIPTEEHPGGSSLLAKLPDGNGIAIWDTAYETTSIPAADYEHFGAAHRLIDGLPEDADAPETEIPLTRTGSLWGDLAALIHAVKALYDAAK
ncbi:hypothetical protein [Streptomyces sp. S1D4-20]|uniref:hypothetical protein n=1 Tax=Streptomyces sp. S1D4-20 TaxID=2594462 RepID=UPI0011653862|nr:hypothetical protein [Streptomyces sp. S1D4-20]QDN54065.1 hypothetical protein FNV67_00350 [Streptomyces sp. S1D4-20]